MLGVSRLLVGIADGRIRRCARAPAPGGKQFVCYCEDVVAEDVSTAVAEGYDSMELLKRYSTITMGACQGKMCSANPMHLCARSTGRSLEETGRTTARPPADPVPLGALAGQKMEPVQLSPIHAWHESRDAHMLVAGLWLRPEHYGDPASEVRAVRERVGLIDVSPLGKLRLTGPGVPELLERLTAVDLANEAFPYMHVRTGTVAGVPSRLLRIGFTGELSYEIHCPAGAGLHLWETIMDAGRDLGIAPFGVEAQRILRLEKGHLIVGQDTDAISDPFGAGLTLLVAASDPVALVPALRRAVAAVDPELPIHDVQTMEARATEVLAAERFAAAALALFAGLACR